MLIIADLVHTPVLHQLEILRNHLLVINEQGFIEYIASSGLPESLRILQDAHESPTVIPSGSFLLPTFCDLHLHAPQFLYQGTGLHLPLMEWLDEYAFKAEERLDADPVLAETVYQRLADRLIEHGTGAVLLFGTIKTETNLILANVMQSAGIRAFVGKLSMDISSHPTYVEASAEAALSAAESFATRCMALVASLPEHERLVQPVLTPRFVPTCSDRLLRGLGKLSRQRRIRIQSHMAEAQDQMEHVRQERGVDDMAVFERSDLLTDRTVQAHCTFLNAPALSSLAECGTAVAHCPMSNAYFSAEPFRLREALQIGTKVGLGTDVAGGYSIDVMNSMRQAVAVSRIREGARIMGCSNTKQPGDAGHDTSLGVDWTEALYLATRGGAIALGLNIGTFSIGAPFDAQCIRIFDPDTGSGIGPLDFFDNSGGRTLTPQMIEKWWCLGDVRNRNGMWVQGKKVD